MKEKGEDATEKMKEGVGGDKIASLGRKNRMEWNEREEKTFTLHFYGHSQEVLLSLSSPSPSPLIIRLSTLTFTFTFTLSVSLTNYCT